MTEFAVITIPVTEWNDLKNSIEQLTKSVMELRRNEKSEYLTPNEACELLKCSRNTLQSYINTGLIQAIKMKKEKYSKILIKRVDVEFFINKNN